MKKLWIIMLALVFVSMMAVNAFAIMVPLSWTAPTENANPDCSPNGTPLDDLAGFRVGWGTTPGVPTSFHDVADPSAVSAVIDVGAVEDITLYFYVQAHDFSGNYSCFGNEVVVPFGPMAPMVPTEAAAGTPY